MSLLDQVIKDETISTVGSSVSVGELNNCLGLRVFTLSLMVFKAYKKLANIENTPSLSRKANINQ